MERRLQDVMVPKNVTSFKVSVNETWRRNYGEYNTVFGVEYNLVNVALLFKAEGNQDGSITGSFWMWVLGSTTDMSGELKKISDVDSFDSEHEFEIGFDDDEVYIVEKKSPISFKQSYKITGVSEPMRFIAPDFKIRPLWDVLIQLV